MECDIMQGDVSALTLPEEQTEYEEEMNENSRTI